VIGIDETLFRLFGGASIALLGFISLQVWNLSRSMSETSVFIKTHAALLENYGKRLHELELRFAKSNHTKSDSD
jgi:hypothetical protein